MKEKLYNPTSTGETQSDLPLCCKGVPWWDFGCTLQHIIWPGCAAHLRLLNLPLAKQGVKAAIQKESGYILNKDILSRVHEFELSKSLELHTVRRTRVLNFRVSGIKDSVRFGPPKSLSALLLVHQGYVNDVQLSSVWIKG